jgi:hypothetical protein
MVLAAWHGSYSELSDGVGSPKHTRSDVLASCRHFSELPQEIEQGLLGERYFGVTAKPAGPKRHGVPTKSVHEVIGRLLNGPPVAIRPSAELEQDD